MYKAFSDNSHYAIGCIVVDLIGQVEPAIERAQTAIKPNAVSLVGGGYHRRNDSLDNETRCGPKTAGVNADNQHPRPIVLPVLLDNTGE